MLSPGETCQGMLARDPAMSQEPTIMIGQTIPPPVFDPVQCVIMEGQCLRLT